MARGPAELAQGHLQALTLGHGSSPEQVVDGTIGGQEGQAVG